MLLWDLFKNIPRNASMKVVKKEKQIWTVCLPLRCHFLFDWKTMEKYNSSENLHKNWKLSVDLPTDHKFNFNEKAIFLFEELLKVFELTRSH